MYAFDYKPVILAYNIVTFSCLYFKILFERCVCVGGGGGITAPVPNIPAEYARLAHQVGCFKDKSPGPIFSPSPPLNIGSGRVPKRPPAVEPPRSPPRGGILQNNDTEKTQSAPLISRTRGQLKRPQHYRD